MALPACSRCSIFIKFKYFMAGLPAWCRQHIAELITRQQQTSSHK